MVEIASFCGLRPAKQFIDKVPCPPYDVLSSAEAGAYARLNPYSFFHVSKAEIDLEGSKFADEEVYALAAANLRKMIAEGILLHEKQPALYILQQRMGEHVQTGLMAGVAVDDYDNGHVKRHELTRKDKEDDRTRHILSIMANDGQVFLAYRRQSKITEIINGYCKKKPDVDMVLDQVRQRLWVITEPAIIALLVGAFKNVPDVYIADGHHRAAAASRVCKYLREQRSDWSNQQEYNRFMAVLFPADELQILAYNRLILDTNGLTNEELLLRLSDYFTIQKTNESRPEKKHRLQLYLPGQWYQLICKDELTAGKDIISQLDASIVQSYILDKLLDIKDPRTSDKIDFVGGIRGTDYLQKQVDSGLAKAAISLFPTAIEDLLAVADLGLVMPPKSTWFEPKLASGLVVHCF